MHAGGTMSRPVGVAMNELIGGAAPGQIDSQVDRTSRADNPSVFFRRKKLLVAAGSDKSAKNRVEMTKKSADF